MEQIKINAVDINRIAFFLPIQLRHISQQLDELINLHKKNIDE